MALPSLSASLNNLALLTRARHDFSPGLLFDLAQGEVRAAPWVDGATPIVNGGSAGSSPCVVLPRERRLLAVAFYVADASSTAGATG
jgi:hypothetical protein